MLIDWRGGDLAYLMDSHDSTINRCLVSLESNWVAIVLVVVLTIRQSYLFNEYIVSYRHGSDYYDIFCKMIKPVHVEAQHPPSGCRFRFD